MKAHFHNYSWNIRLICIFLKADKDGPRIDILILNLFFQSFLMAHTAVFEFEIWVLTHETSFFFTFRILFQISFGIAIPNNHLQLSIDFHYKRPWHQLFTDWAYKLKNSGIWFTLLIERFLQTSRADYVASRYYARLDHDLLADEAFMPALWWDFYSVMKSHLALATFYCAYVALVWNVIIWWHRCAVKRLTRRKFIPFHLIFYFISDIKPIITAFLYS